MNLLVLLEMSAGAMGERVAFGHPDDGLTVEQLFDRAGRTAAWLREHAGERLLYTGVSGRSAPSASNSGGASTQAVATMLRSRTGVGGRSAVWIGVWSAGRSS